MFWSVGILARRESGLRCLGENRASRNQVRLTSHSALSSQDQWLLPLVKKRAGLPVLYIWLARFGYVLGTVWVSSGASSTFGHSLVRLDTVEKGLGTVGYVRLRLCCPGAA